VLEGHLGNEDSTDRVKDNADKQERKTNLVGSPLGTSSTNNCTAGGREEKHRTCTFREHNNNTIKNNNTYSQGTKTKLHI
jgi:hypothetical protein